MVTINGKLYGETDFMGYTYRSIVPPYANFLLLGEAIEANGEFTLPLPPAGYVAPNYTGGFVSSMGPLNVDRKRIDGRLYHIWDMRQYRYRFFNPVFSNVEPTRGLYKVWIATADEHIYVWDNVEGAWYDICHSVYLPTGDSSDFLWGDATEVLWEDSSKMKKG